MGKLGQDIRYGARTAVRSKSVAILAILAFALGIGVTSAVFSIFNGVLLAPLPYPDPDEIVAVYGTQPACATCPASFPKYHDWKTRNQVFAAMGGSTQASFVLTGFGPAEQVNGFATTASLNDVFRSEPMLGRWYSDQEDQPGGPKVVVLSQRFWQRRFNRDPGVLGQRLLFDGEPVRGRSASCRSTFTRAGDFYVPLQRKLDPATRGESLPGDLRTAAEGRSARSRDSGDACARRDASARVRLQPRHRRSLVPRSDGGEYPWPAPGPARSGAVRAPDRVRQRRQPAAGVGHGSTPGNRGPTGARRRPEGHRAPAHLRIACARGCRRCARAAARDLDRARVRGARGEQPASRRHDPGGRPRPGVYGRDVAGRRNRLRALAAAAAPAEGADDRAARRRHSHRQRRWRHVRQRPGHRRDCRRVRAARRRGTDGQEPACCWSDATPGLRRNASSRSTSRPTGPRYRQPEAVSALYRSLQERLASLGGVQQRRDSSAISRCTDSATTAR